MERLDLQCQVGGSSAAAFVEIRIILVCFQIDNLLIRAFQQMDGFLDIIRFQVTSCRSDKQPSFKWAF